MLAADGPSRLEAPRQSATDTIVVALLLARCCCRTARSGHGSETHGNKTGIGTARREHEEDWPGGLDVPVLMIGVLAMLAVPLRVGAGDMAISAPTEGSRFRSGSRSGRALQWPRPPPRTLGRCKAYSWGAAS